MRLYHLVSIRNDNGRITYLTRYPMTHKECMTMKSKNTEYPFRTITVIEA